MIHITKYNWEYSKESIIEKVFKNKLIKKELNGNTSLNTDELMFYCDEFNSIHRFVIQEFSKIKKVDVTYYALNMWSYIQTNKTETEMFHKHLRVDGGRTNILTEYSFVFYLKIPKGLKLDEGDLLLNVENKIQSIKPMEGDIIFFPGNILHMPKLTPSATEDRIVIAGNISTDFITNKIII
jgi:hypothetical protein